ncbi:FixH family protein [Altererythrobacter sp. ZODW24]|uniref:FixH family protein n=1 Tax=Altererythrobacter sp. ZODW24 TaxID=2185142 RepID=UPI000DF840B0|nr:FixH family protein [Altererythrobacter sp. ZODW24]
MSKPFTGRHMTMVMVGGFGIVIAVNAYMATLAVGGFSGVVVKNSYVASQQFNGWLEQTEAQEALGWHVVVSRVANGRVSVAMQDVPENAVLTAVARRPLGEPDTRDIVFTGNPVVGFQSAEPLPAGRWLMRISVTDGDDEWRSESELK